MREDCLHFQSRTYDSGEVARFCTLDLAPEAPWRCPENCASYEHGLSGGTLVDIVRPAVEDEPDESPEDIAEVLRDAEAIVTAAEPEVVGEVEREGSGRKWWQVWKRRDPGEGEDFHFSDR